METWHVSDAFPLLIVLGTTLVPSLAPITQQRYPTCPTVTRAPRLDAIVAPEKSFFKPSVDRQVRISTRPETSLTLLSYGSLLPYPVCVPTSSHNCA